ncbi:SDR family oxidoreductase [Stenotrophomonas cyclobalanopsidis]|uniref:SDR family oxidoreductase n=1 Tax=Stenotrophomonas cyclobalanopsidis TaxID=2771362 RepID=A0ABQ6T240_9GAMM|nr:SDR family oxidoreductase [Stenotrophomonas cyclobalanopsidis]KAA8999538.1 SDR family oxidoreductase [Stenotrophomonas cyclobalanopsidis]
MSITLITGGSRGIGASTARACARRGHGIILTCQQNAEAAQAVVRQIADEGGPAVALPLDVGQVHTFAGFRAEVEHALASHWPTAQLTGLVNNAGHGLFNPIATVSEAQFDGLFNVHLKGPFFLTQMLLPLLGPQASIVNVSSATTRVATAGVAPYAAFKGGLEVLTRYMAKEFGPQGIRVNSVSPGPIRTELGGGLDAAFETALSAQTALGRVGEPEEVARVIASLLCADSGWVTAQNVEVSGGYVI